MSEPRFTPGPWEWELGYLVGAEGMLVLQKPFVGVDARPDKVYIRNPADKTLIQAAPDLYAALEKARAFIECVYELTVDNMERFEAESAMEIAESALAKARGEVTGD